MVGGGLAISLAIPHIATTIGNAPAADGGEIERSRSHGNPTRQRFKFGNTEQPSPLRSVLLESPQER